MTTRSGTGFATASSLNTAKQDKNNGLSAYEIQRLDNIRRNEEVLKSLNLTSFKVEVGPSSRGPTQRGVTTSSRKRAASPAPPTRASSRTKGEIPEYAGIDREHADGKVELMSGEVVMPGSAEPTVMPALKIDPRLPIPFHRLNDEEEEQEAVAKAELESDPVVKTAEQDDDDEEDKPLSMRAPLAARAAAAATQPTPDARDRSLLATISQGQGLGQGKPDASDTTRTAAKKAKTAIGSSVEASAGALDAAAAKAPAAGLAQCTLDESMVVKVTKKKLVHLHFQPRSDTLLLAAGDSDGHISLWHAHRDADDPSDGVHLHKPHASYVSGLAWCPRQMSALYSSSYDGSLRCLHLERAEFVPVHRSSAHEFSAFTIAASNAATAWLGTNSGELGAVDVRTGKVCTAMASYSGHGKKINTLSLDQHGRDWLLASAGTDATVHIWDVRKITKPLLAIDLPKASQGAEWAPDGSTRLAVTCFDSRLRIFALGGETACAPQGTAGSSSNKGKAKVPTPTTLIKHDTQTGRWVVPFRAIWTAGADAIICGGMKRTADIYAAAQGTKLASLSSELMTAIPARNAAHPSGRAIACATNSGRVHIFES